MNLLFLMHHGQNSRDIFLDIVAGAREAGHRAFVMPAEHLAMMCAHAGAAEPTLRSDVCRLLAEFIQENQIELTVAMWANALRIAGLTEVAGAHGATRTVTFFEAIRSPLLNLWLDAPERAQAGSLAPYFHTPVVASPYVFHFINNEGSAAEMQKLFGFTNVLPVPYGTNAKVFRPVEGPKDFDIMFSVGGGEAWTTPTPAMADEVRRDEPDLQRVREDLATRQVRPMLDRLVAPVEMRRRGAVRAALDRLVQIQLANRAMPMTQRLGQIAGESKEMAAAVAYLQGDAKLYVESVQTIRAIESFLRVFYFVYLARYFRCGIYGSIDLSPWGCPVKSEGFIPYDQQGRMYSRAWMGLSVMRWQDDVGVHIKPFEIMASGAACLAEKRVGMEGLWTEGKEIVTFTSPAEARKKAAALLADPAKLRDIAAAGRARTMREHTWGKRIATIAELVRRLRPA